MNIQLTLMAKLHSWWR